jgi:hypothetical protein
MFKAYTRQILLLGILVAAILQFGANCECEQPVIDSMTPGSGPGGTIVEVVYSKGGLSGTIEYDGALVETRNAGNLGIGKTLFFTIPYGATAGGKNVRVYSGEKYSAAQTFNVTGSAAVPTPAIDGYAFGNAQGSELTIFGSNFSTLTEVFIDGVEADHYSGVSLPLRQIPHDFVDNLIICTPASNFVAGTSYGVQARNPGGINSGTVNFTFPSRVCEMEFDAITGTPVPDYYVWQNNTVNTIRRSYSECGWVIELAYDDTSVVDPNAGTPFSSADLYTFWQANAAVPASGYYMHGGFIPDGPTARGVMYMNTGRIPTLPASEYRLGFAVFWDDFAGYADRMQKYFRTTLHEAAHGFNLEHSDQDADQTLLTTTPSLAAGWHCFFSNLSCTHLESHNLTAVGPGGDAFLSRSCDALH